MRSPHARPGTRKPEARAAAPVMQQPPTCYVGVRVLKQFKRGWYRGAVVATRDGGARLGPLFVTFYSDGDHEELSWPELAAVMVAPKKPKAAARRARRVAAAAPAPRAKQAAVKPLQTPAPRTQAAVQPVHTPAPAPKARHAGLSRSPCVGVKLMVTGQYQARLPPSSLWPGRLLGNFSSQKGAARAVDRALRSVGAPESALNFPNAPADNDDDASPASAAGAHPASERRLVVAACAPTAGRRPVPLQPVARRETAVRPSSATDDHEDEDTFVRSLQPPLSGAAAVLALLRSNGVTMRHLRALGAVLAHPGVSAAAKERTCAAAFDDCGVHAPQDKATLRAALQRACRRL